jgi:hypothetical protein
MGIMRFSCDSHARSWLGAVNNDIDPRREGSMRLARSEQALGATGLMGSWGMSSYNVIVSTE